MRSRTFLDEIQLRTTFHRCHEKTSYVSNYAFITLLHEWVDRRQMHQLENSSVCNSDFNAGSVLLEFFKAMLLPSINPFMQ